MKKKILVLGFICTLLTSNITALAAEDAFKDNPDEILEAEYIDSDEVFVTPTITVQFVQADNVVAKLTINGKTAEARTIVSAKSPCTIKITMYLQRKSGGSWVTQNTWSSSYTKARSASFTKTAAISSGTYRTKSVMTVNGEKITSYSVTKTK